MSYSSFRYKDYIIVVTSRNGYFEYEIQKYSDAIPLYRDSKFPSASSAEYAAKGVIDRGSLTMGESPVGSTHNSSDYMCCIHEPVNVGFTHTRMVCKKCNKELPS